MPISNAAAWKPFEDWLSSADSRELIAEVHRQFVKYEGEAKLIVRDYARCAYLAQLAPEGTPPPPLVARAARLHRSIVTVPFPRSPAHLMLVQSRFDASHEATIPRYRAEFDEEPDPRLWTSARERFQIRWMLGAFAVFVILGLVGVVAHAFDLAVSPEVWAGAMGVAFVNLLAAAFNQPIARKWL